MVIKLVEIYGLDFRPTPEDLAKLRNASASDALIGAIEAARMPPSPKPLPKEGHLAVVCEPVDCEVSLNGEPAGRTTHGVLPWITRVQGSVIVTAVREGYEPALASQETQIRPNQVARVEFLFKPSRAALTTAGNALFRQMIESLGDDGNQPRTFRATGTLYIQSAGEHRTAWSLTEWLNLDDLSRFELNRLRENYQITVTQPGLQWTKPPKTQEARELEPLIRLLIDNRLPNLLQRFKDPRCTMVAVESAPESEASTAFRVEGNPETYTIILDSAHRPSEIRIESSDPKSRLRLLYSDYAEQGGISYPITTQIILPDGFTGVEAHFDTMQVSPSLSRAPKKRFRR
jgi:hypothetical protein